MVPSGVCLVLRTIPKDWGGGVHEKQNGWPRQFPNLGITPPTPRKDAANHFNRLAVQRDAQREGRGRAPTAAPAPGRGHLEKEKGSESFPVIRKGREKELW